MRLNDKESDRDQLEKLESEPVNTEFVSQNGSVNTGFDSVYLTVLGSVAQQSEVLNRNPKQ